MNIRTIPPTIPALSRRILPIDLPMKTPTKLNAKVVAQIIEAATKILRFFSAINEIPTARASILVAIA